ncbi:MAG: hypothetical protein ACR2IH_00890 [Pyrinomonadaceae bacterium]
MIRKKQGSMVKKAPILVLLTAIFALNVRVEAQKTIEYLGYHISITIPKTKNYSVVTIKKGRKSLAVHSEGLAQDYGSSVELISLLGSDKKQLVISQYTGGNHCCNLYWIYELTPKFRLLFRSKDFETIGYSEVQKLFQNIDRDAEMEIVDNTPAFHYFDELAFVSSPAPTLIFDYNRRARRFELANRRFTKYLLKVQTGWIARTEAVRDSNPSQYQVDTFGLFLAFVYAGREKTGWNYYHSEKAKSKSASYFHLDSVIRRALNADPAYRTLYRK